MKSLILIFSTSLFLLGCIQMRYITEQHIKTTKEIHNPGEYSSIKLYPIYQGFTNKSQSDYIELTGYKYNGTKKMVIAADEYYKARKKFLGDNTVIAEVTFIELDIEQCKTIVNNYKTLLEKLKQDKPKHGESVYQDYTVSKDLFISFRKSRLNNNPDIISFWIKGNKFSLRTKLIIGKLEKFLKY